MITTKEKHATFTPGPWHAHSTKVSTWETQEQVEFHGDEVIAETGFEANARLIAATPEMYEVLSELLDTLEMSKGYGFDEEYEKLREVLAKVEGGEG